MFNGNRSDRSALIVLGLIVASLICVSIIGLTTRYVANYPAYDRYSAAHQSGNPDVGVVAAAILDFNPWDDTIAQWSMAIFTAWATLLSALAVFFIWRTLEATSRIGQAQVRAYLSVIDVEVKIVPHLHVLFRMQLKNSGQSPALETVIYDQLTIRTESRKIIYRKAYLEGIQTGPISAGIEIWSILHGDSWQNDPAGIANLAKKLPSDASTVLWAELHITVVNFDVFAIRSETTNYYTGAIALKDGQIVCQMEQWPFVPTASSGRQKRSTNSQA